MPYQLGIDLGTTFTSAAVARDGRVQTINLGARTAAMPSVVLIRENGDVLVGEAAESRALVEPARAAREFKRRLGDSTPINLGGTPYRAEVLTGFLLRAVHQRVVDRMGERPERVVLTHPATYSPAQLELLRGAARRAGIGEVELLSEPAAAAVHYASIEQVPAGAALAVYDFGGGNVRGRSRSARHEPLRAGRHAPGHRAGWAGSTSTSPCSVTSTSSSAAG